MAMTFRRWQFPFFTKEEAEKFVGIANKESGQKAFVKKVTYPISFYKIFTSEQQARKYVEQKTKKFSR